MAILLRKVERLIPSTGVFMFLVFFLVNFRIALEVIKIRIIRAFRGRKSKKWGSKCNFSLKMFGSYEKMPIFASKFML